MLPSSSPKSESSTGNWGRSSVCVRWLGTKDLAEAEQVKKDAEDQLARIRSGESAIASKLLADGHTIVDVLFGSEEIGQATMTDVGGHAMFERSALTCRISLLDFAYAPSPSQEVGSTLHAPPVMFVARCLAFCAKSWEVHRSPSCNQRATRDRAVGCLETPPFNCGPCGFVRDEHPHGDPGCDNSPAV